MNAQDGTPPPPDGADRLPVEAGRRLRAAELEPPHGWQAPLLDLAAAVLRHWQMVLIVLTLGVGVGAVRYLTTRPYYRAACVAQLLAREKPVLDLQVTHGAFESGRDLASRGETGALMLPPEVALYSQLLRSDAVLSAIGARFGPRLGLADDLRADQVVRAVRDAIRISGTEEGIITVEATAHDPTLAADLANALVDEMAEASKTAERQLLRAQIVHLGPELERRRAEAERCERELEAFLRRHDIVDLTRQTHDLLSLLRDTEYVRQGLVQQRLERLEAFTEDDHVARGLQRRIEQCDADLAQLRERIFGSGTDRDGQSVQQLELRVAAMKAELQRARDLAATLASQLQLYQVRLDQPAGAVSVPYPAEPVRQRAGPGKGEMLGTALLIAAILGVVLALLREQFAKVDRDPYLARRAEEIRAHVRVLAPEWLLAAGARRPRASPREPVGSGGPR